VQDNRPFVVCCHRHTNDGRREGFVETGSAVWFSVRESRAMLSMYRGSNITAFMARFSSFLPVRTMAMPRY
jgi:hypothetical protein